MDDSRTKNVSRNIFFGTVNKLTSLIMPFISRTLMIYLIGTTSLGVSTLFSSVLSFLSLAELGFGSAIVYSMYQPIANSDIKLISALLLYYRHLYRIIGFIVLVIGLALIPFLPHLIAGEIPEGVDLNILFLLYLFNSVISYFFSGYRQSLLLANQRADVRDKISMIVNILVRFSEIIVIYLTRNLYFYVTVMIFGTICTNVITAIVTRKMFPEIKCEGVVPQEIKNQIKTRLFGLFGTKLNSIVVHQADTIIISAFLGLKLTTQYGNYYYIISTVSGFVMMFFSSMTASIGNKVVSESSIEVYKLFKKINFLNNWIIGWCSICLVCLYHPFMLLWVKSTLTLPVIMSVLMTIYFYMSQISRTVLTFKDAAGLWHEDRFRPYVSMVVNLTSNLILIRWLGIYGIVLSTIIAYIISIPWCNYVLFINLFKKSSLKYNIYQIKQCFITCVIALITYVVCSAFSFSVLGFIGRIVICLFIPNIIFVMIFHRSEDFAYIKSTLRGILSKK